MAGKIKYRVKSAEPRLSQEACRFETTSANTTFDVATRGISSLSEVSTGVYRVTLHNTPGEAVVTATMSLPDAIFADDEYGVWVAQDNINSNGTFDVHPWKSSASGVQNLTDAYVNINITLIDVDI